MKRATSIERESQETKVNIDICVDGVGKAGITTPLPYLNHLLDAFARHGLIDLSLRADGDAEADGHATIEDVGRALGAAFRIALGDRAGITRYGSATIPLDETLVTCAVDFCGQSTFVWKVDGLDHHFVSGFDCELAREFFAAFSARAECALHVVLHYGNNASHILEATFKALARACDAATRIDSRLLDAPPATKETPVR